MFYKFTLTCSNFLQHLFNSAGVSGYVKNRDGAPLASATLTLNGNELPIPLMPSGFFHHVLADGNSHQLTASAPGYTRLFAA